MESEPKYFFISGLPRSGSTLLAAILLQNPKFHAGMHNGLTPVFLTAIKGMTTTNEFQSELTNTQRYEMLKGLIRGFYHDKQDKQVIFDTSRHWQAWAHLLVKMYPYTKFICCVRNVEWIMDSLERFHREKPWAGNVLWGEKNGGKTVYDRANMFAETSSITGMPLASISQALSSPESGRILVVDYDILTRSPKRVLKEIYKWIGEPYFPHDFDNVEFEDEPMFDKLLAAKGLHQIRRKVEPNMRTTILPQKVFNQLKALNGVWNTSNTQAKFILEKF